MIINNSKKFKTTVITVRFKEEINQKHVAYRALLPKVMSASTPTYKKRKELIKALKSLYGATISARTIKIGKLSVVDFSLVMLNSSFIEIEYLEKALIILKEIIYDHKNLNKTNFETEKKLLLQQIKHQDNNKTSFALRRLIEIMFKDKQYAIKHSGEYFDVEKITYPDFNNYYKKHFKTNDCDVIVSGDIDAEIMALVAKNFTSTNNNNLYPLYEKLDFAEETTDVVEYDGISQTKLNIGYNLPINYDQSEHLNAFLFNAVFGGESHSRLFTMLREKHSLCYYITSVYDPFQGFLYVYSGVDKARVDLALKLIAEILKELQEKPIKEEELQLSKAALINDMFEREDNQISALEANYLKYLLKKDTTIDQTIAKINRVTAVDILNVAKKVKINTIYLLAPENDNET